MEGGTAKRWWCSISLFCKMGDKGEGGVKNLKKWVTSSMIYEWPLIVKHFTCLNKKFAEKFVWEDDIFLWCCITTCLGILGVKEDLFKMSLLFFWLFEKFWKIVTLETARYFGVKIEEVNFFVNPRITTEDILWCESLIAD